MLGVEPSQNSERQFRGGLPVTTARHIQVV